MARPSWLSTFRAILVLMPFKSVLAQLTRVMSIP
jgi:hypothetical protein